MIWLKLVGTVKKPCTGLKIWGAESFSVNAIRIVAIDGPHLTRFFIWVACLVPSWSCQAQGWNISFYLPVYSTPCTPATAPCASATQVLNKAHGNITSGCVSHSETPALCQTGFATTFQMSSPHVTTQWAPTACAKLSSECPVGMTSGTQGTEIYDFITSVELTLKWFSLSFLPSWIGSVTSLIVHCALKSFIDAVWTKYLSHL